MIPTPLITAAEGYPALERLCAEAQGTLYLSFRILDPRTRLHAPQLTERGLDSWADLIAWVTRRGVRLRLLLADFDPVFASDLHRQAWANASGFADVVQGDAQILVAPHGQEAGRLWHLAMLARLRRSLSGLRKEDPTRLTPVQRALLATRPRLRPATLHQKFATADGRRAVIGGLDVDPRRFDTPAHDRPPEETWHDVSVAVQDDDFVGALDGHFAECWNAALACGAASLADPARPLDTRVKPQARADLRLLRTFSVPCTGAGRLAPTPRLTEHETALLRLFGEAQDYLYIETQFLRHAPLVDTLCDAAARSAALQLIVMLPLAPERVLFDGHDGWDARHAHGLQTAALTRLRAAYGTRLALVTPGQRRPAPEGAPQIAGAGPVYVHSKVVIADDLTAVVGSANLNGRSMRWDTEASVLVKDRGFARGLLERLARTWLGEAGGDPRRATTWTGAASDNAALPPEARHGLVLPYPVARAERFSRRLFALPDDMF